MQLASQSARDWCIGVAWLVSHLIASATSSMAAHQLPIGCPVCSGGDNSWQALHCYLYLPAVSCGSIHTAHRASAVGLTGTRHLHHHNMFGADIAPSNTGNTSEWFIYIYREGFASSRDSYYYPSRCQVLPFWFAPTPPRAAASFTINNLKWRVICHVVISNLL